jgi:hypothetical protein
MLQQAPYCCWQIISSITNLGFNTAISYQFASRLCALHVRPTSSTSNWSLITLGAVHTRIMNLLTVLSFCIFLLLSASYGQVVPRPFKVKDLHESPWYLCLHATSLDLRGTASTSNIEILECFQSKALRMTVDTPWYVPNTVNGMDFQIPTVKEEIRH